MVLSIVVRYYYSGVFAVSLLLFVFARAFCFGAVSPQNPQPPPDQNINESMQVQNIHSP